MAEMSRDADKMLCCLYKEYLTRRKHGIAKHAAGRFTDEYSASDPILSKWLSDDIDTTILELKSRKYLNYYITGDYELRDDAIIYMENRFKNGLLEITDFIAKFIP